ncbi:16S rRNA (guanine(527)-N(7))-methyltransferase RsmG [Luteipulveratus mongoliensis]|uniref:Ribosomal RNA small subunit methyltransferase G n=1 Tax=Luteipulveratus mongoliensis TaxID=571913 RepID=A0A0K1JEG6_9MICO|nr:16S rRNA (guanine(527)-N(7))-methyltransferase RsmG [Luteipulveratus mongoliensis]AKU14988.1 16S rRNA methyltransferase [Luteipulveratus mongoliensis]
MEPDDARGPDQAPPPAPSGASAIFGSQLELAEAYVAHLASTGVSHGLIGPREVPRLWDRHILNCAVIHPAFDEDSSVADVGAGAGLPGMVLALTRPDLRVTLVEPLERRTRWLEHVARDIGLSNVVVRRGKAEQLWDDLSVDAVTSRAVARLGELARLSLPLLRPQGRMVALKGERAQVEVTEDADILRRLRVAETAIATYGEGLVDPPTTVVALRVDGTSPRLRTPVGSGPALSAEKKRAKRAQRRSSQL